MTITKKIAYKYNYWTLDSREREGERETERESERKRQRETERGSLVSGPEPKNCLSFQVGQ